jgi:hypothetical protein
MDDKKSDVRTIAEEAVGQTRGSPTPDTAKDQAVAPTDAEAMRQLATSAGTTGRHCNQNRRVGWRAGRRCVRGRHDGRGDRAVAEHC